jgi:hypothetical protein
MTHSETFGPHRNNPLERIRHRTNIRVEIVKNISSERHEMLNTSIVQRLKDRHKEITKK